MEQFTYVQDSNPQHIIPSVSALPQSCNVYSCLIVRVYRINVYSASACDLQSDIGGSDIRLSPI
jgi:hypothetical protein